MPLLNITNTTMAAATLNTTLDTETTVNQTYSCTMLWNPPYHIMSAVIAFLIISVNLFVMALFIKNRNLRKSPANYLLLSFSISDMLSGISIVVHILPYYYLFLHTCEETKIKFGNGYHLAANMLSYSLLLVSTGHLLLLSSERFLSLYYALRYQTLVTNFRILIAACFAWFIGGVAAMIQLIWMLPFQGNETEENRRSFMIHNYYYIIVSIITLIFVPAIILITQYTWLFLLIRRLVQSAPGTTKTERSLKERKALIIYCGMFVCFLLCCVPLITIQLILNIDVDVAHKIPLQVLEGVFLLRYIVSFINPLLYTLYKRDFRRAATTTLRSCPIPLCKILLKNAGSMNEITLNSYCEPVTMTGKLSVSSNRSPLMNNNNDNKPKLSFNNLTVEASYQEKAHLLK